jgi:transcriptional regulator with XRE-family HTH domain
MKIKKPGPPKGQKQTEVKRSPFGERLYKIRKARGMTQETVGEKIGVSKRVIAFYEGNHNGPEPDLLKKIASALNVTVSYLLGESILKNIEPEVPPSLRKHVDKLKKLPPKDQKTAIRMIDALAAQNGIKE